MGTADSDRWMRFTTLLFQIGLAAASIGGTALAQDLRSEEADRRCLEIQGPLQDAVRFVEEAFNKTLTGTCIRAVPKEVIEEAFALSAGMLDHPPNIGGLYVITEGTILIPSDLDSNKALDLSFVVHELVHAYQYEAGLLLPEASLAPLECEAYSVQAAFLRSRGLPREALLMSLQGELQAGSVCEY